MVAFHAGQVVLLAVVVGIVVWRARVLLALAALDAAVFRRAVRRALLDGRRPDALRLARAARPAWVARVVEPLLEPGASEEGRANASDERRHDLEADAVRGLRALRVLATSASALGFLGAILMLRWMAAGDHGLLALAAGKVESIAIGNAATSIALGIATSGFALGALAVLQRAARDVVRDMRRVATDVEALRADLEEGGVRDDPPPQNGADEPYPRRGPEAAAGAGPATR
ncbi:MAG: hypothetical protein ACFCGT_16780 [Sandaracinaceae bacterium]